MNKLFTGQFCYFNDLFLLIKESIHKLFILYLKIPNLNHYIPFSKSYLVLIACRDLSLEEYTVNIGFDPTIHIIDIMYMYN